MKSDTSKEMDIRFRKLLEKKTNEERLIMGCSMYDTAKAIITASILNRNPHITAIELKKEIFFRFYGLEIAGGIAV